MAENPQDLVQTVPLPPPLLSPPNRGKQLIVISKERNTCSSCTQLYSADHKPVETTKSKQLSEYLLFSHTSNLFLFPGKKPNNQDQQEQAQCYWMLHTLRPLFSQEGYKCTSQQPSYTPHLSQLSAACML